MPELEAELAQRVGLGEEVVLATVVRLEGEPPSRSGAKAIFDRERQLAGTLGCSEFDSQARAEAGGILDEGSPVLRAYRHDLGAIEVYLEPYARRPLLVVLADTPVAAALRRWAPELGFDVTAEVPAEPAAPGAPAESGRPRESGRLAEAGGRELYVVHTDHDHPDLVPDLLRLLALGPRYIGLMGSRRHTGHHLEALRARGMAAADVERIQTPVGLDLGAQSAPEIALSILAGLVALRRGGPGGWKDTPPTAPPPPAGRPASPGA